MQLLQSLSVSHAQGLQVKDTPSVRAPPGPLGVASASVPLQDYNFGAIPIATIEDGARRSGGRYNIRKAKWPKEDNRQERST